MKRILIVDDEAALVWLIKLNLEDTGHYEVKTETKGTQALRAAQTFQPDLILLDIMMPDLSGFEVARQIQADENLKHIPIVFLTGAPLEDETIKGGREKSNPPLPFSCVSKPLSADELIDYIEQNIGKP